MVGALGDSSVSPAGAWAQLPARRSPPPQLAGDRQAGVAAAAAQIQARVGGGSAPGQHLRIAFVGDRGAFGPTALPARLPGVDSFFVHHPGTGDAQGTVAAVEQLAPHVVFAYRPETMVGVLCSLAAPLKVGVFTEPFPAPGWEGRKDLQEHIIQAMAVDAGLCEMFIAVNPLDSESLESIVPVWCYMALPVCDDVFCGYDDIRTPDVSQGVHVGPWTDRAERFLTGLEPRLGWTLMDPAAMGDLDRFSVALNLRADEPPGFDHRLPLHLARGNLVLSQPVTPTYELQEGLHALFFQDAHQLNALVDLVDRCPEQSRTVAVRGRLIAESFRASRAWLDRIVDLACLL
jgi:hypothetical protein